MRGRLLLYAIALPGIVALDIVTPLGVADWLLVVILVWIASVWGRQREMILVAAAGSAIMLGGLWSSPDLAVPFWMGAVNRLAAVVLTWAMVDVARRRRAAEEAERRAAAEIKILRGLVPICAACKAIRTPAGQWQKLESYLSANSEAHLTHSLCPLCLAKYMDEAP
jgi:hypothetical protein